MPIEPEGNFTALAIVRETAELKVQTPADLENAVAFMQAIARETDRLLAKHKHSKQTAYIAHKAAVAAEQSDLQGLSEATKKVREAMTAYVNKREQVSSDGLMIVNRIPGLSYSKKFDFTVDDGVLSELSNTLKLYVDNKKVFQNVPSGLYDLLLSIKKILPFLSFNQEKIGKIVIGLGLMTDLPGVEVEETITLRIEKEKHV